ncbi:MAG: S26 family signal peptidase, partial [Muribaculaceae bacterium]|nr:S26 family signal peptidase [Muribaculaceae bacterium]
MEQKPRLFSKDDFLSRLRAIKATRWVRFSIVCLVYILWVIWMGNPWLLLVLPLLFDIYISSYIPLTWWKSSKSKVTRTVMSWVDAIVYALVLVYFIFAFVGQNYKIPSSSLEKTLLVGDYLWVNKAVYGPRVPQTPIHFPLAQHTLPVTNSKSYSDIIELSYHRLPGLRSVERYDLVVFNAPYADTVALKMQEPDYYHIVDMLEAEGVPDGRAYIAAHPEQFGEVVWRPVDRRENFVKRTIGLPGDRLKIVDDIIYINGKPLTEPKYVQHNYVVPVSSPVSSEQWKGAGVSLVDAGAAPQTAPGIDYQFYNVPLTSESLAKVKKFPQVSGEIVRLSKLTTPLTQGIFPLGEGLGWELRNMPEFWIPKQGATLHLTPQNLPVYRRASETYE